MTTTRISIDSELVKRVLEASGECMKEAAVTRALEEFVPRYKQLYILSLTGTLEWDTGFDYKLERSRGSLPPDIDA